MFTMAKIHTPLQEFQGGLLKNETSARKSSSVSLRRDRSVIAEALPKVYGQFLRTEFMVQDKRFESPTLLGDGNNAAIETRRYGSYQEYLEHQKQKTLDPLRREKWLGKEWELKIQGFEQLFQGHWSHISRCKRALCLGARTGQEVQALRNLGVEAIGIDLVPCEPLVVEGDIHAVPFDNESFDLVFSNVFDHSLYPEKFIEEIERVLKPGGVSLLQFQVARGNDEFSACEIQHISPVLKLFKSSEVLINRQLTTNFASMNWELLTKKRHSEIRLHWADRPVMHCQEEIERDLDYEGLLPDNVMLAWFNDAYSASKHLLVLYSIARGLRAQSILEVGFGRSSFVLARAAAENGGRFLTCDGKNFSYLLSAKEKEVTTFFEGRTDALWSRIDGVVQFAFLDYFSDPQTDAAFIVGEIERCSSFLPKNGIIAVHDAIDERYQVAAALEQLKSSRRFEILVLPYNYGLGLIRLTEDSGKGTITDIFKKKR